MKVSVVIPVYKQKKLFLDNLSSNLRFLADCEVVVVDDASDEDLEKDIKARFPQVRVLTNQKNLGFAGAVNRGVYASSGDLIMLLNSDVRLQDRSFIEAIDKMRNDRSLFAVSFLQVERDGRSVGKNRIFFEKGFIQHSKAPDISKGLNGWVEGGAFIVRKKYFDQLGGFDSLYNPFYWEDVDLSYRAYRRGWKVLFDPRVKVIHHHETTIGAYFDKAFIKRVAYRNQFVFFWKNVDSLSFWISHLIRLPLHLASSIARGDITFVLAFLEGLMMYPKIILRRLKTNKYAVKDEDVITLFHDNE